ncbi:MAG TPA: sigma-70 family RNA polymerase sigma factor [Chloroflexota bacterium]|nr:sigma-70 family RNA polymerase sigma factor [Chloroflexota bacterium]
MATYPALTPADAAGVWTGTSSSDVVFVARLRVRDPEAFAYLYERYKSQIYNYLLRLSGTPELADDLTHDTFLSAYEALPTLRADSAISAWLYRIASNRFKDVLRRKRIISWLSLGDRQDVERSLSTSGGQEAVPERELVQTALRHVKPEYAICLVLRLAEGFSTEETAVILKASPESIRMRLCRARQMFKTAYAAAESGEIR